MRKEDREYNKSMKKIIIGLILLFVPGLVFAEVNPNLYYGLMHDSRVTELQQFLIGKGFLTSKATGNFLSMTFSAVKNYQASKNIKQSGIVGFLTRQAIAEDLGTATLTTPKNPVFPKIPLYGSLDVSRSADYSGQPVTAPQTNFKLADFSLKNNASEAINLKTLQINLAIGSNLYSANLYVSNLYAVYAENKTAVLNQISHTNSFTIDYNLPVGQTIDISVFGDVNSLIPLDSTVNPSIMVSGVTAVSATAMDSRGGTFLNGQVAVFAKGLLAVAEGSSGSAGIVLAGQKVSVGEIQFTSTADSYNITELKFVIAGQDLASVVSKAEITDSETKTVLNAKPPAIYSAGKNYILDFNVDIPVGLNSSKSVEINFDLTKNINSYLTAQNISPALVYVKAKNSKGVFTDGLAQNFSNNIVAINNGISLPDDGLTGSNLYVYKSIPTFSKEELATATVANNSKAELYNFSIKANEAGDISVKQIAFKITISDPGKVYPHLNRFEFFKNGVNYTSSVIIAHDVNNNYIGLTNDSGIGAGTETIYVTFNNEENILAGKTQTYSLKAITNRFTDGASISTNISGDSAMSSNRYLRMAFINIYGLAKSATDIYVNRYSLLWSDKSAAYPYHSDTNNFSTNDWYNAFEVPGLPLSAETLSAK